MNTLGFHGIESYLRRGESIMNCEVVIPGAILLAEQKHVDELERSQEARKREEA
jgi:hypothetical protein